MDTPKYSENNYSNENDAQKIEEIYAVIWDGVQKEITTNGLMELQKKIMGVMSGTVGSLEQEEYGENGEIGQSLRTLDEIMERFKVGMLKSFPDQQEKIIAAMDNALKAVNQLLANNKGLIEIRDFFNQSNFRKDHPAIQHSLDVAFSLIATDIGQGRILIPKLKN